MNDKLIEIAKANGADLVEPYTSVMSKREMLTMTPDQLRSTIGQVCAPLVRYAEALELLDVITGIESQGYSALKAYRTLIGDKE